MAENNQTTITVCETCKRPGWDAKTAGGTDGEQLIAYVRAVAESENSVQIRTHPCLMGCDFACNVSVQSQGKIAYAIGTFEPSQESAEAIVTFATLHAQSETGQVPYKTWPQAIKGHFRARIFPDPKTE